MNLGLLFAGVGAWVGVGALAVGMAAWGKPVWGFFPILAAVIAAWAVGEYVTDVIWKSEGGD
jgi:hypothetical protein